MHCGDSTNTLHCPGDLQYFTCVISSASLEWTSKEIFDNDIEFFNSPVGTVKTTKGFSANVSNKTGYSYLVSVLTFSTNSSQTGKNITCVDLYSGDSKNCIINATYPSK